MWDNSSHSLTRWLWLGLAVGIGACGGNGGGQGAEPTPITSAPGAPTTLPAPTIDLSRPIPGGSLHGAPRPRLENTGDDYVAITKSLIANFRWLTENPDLRVISDLMVPGTPGYDARIPAYQFLLDNGYHWADEGYQIVSVEALDAKPDVVSLRVVDALEFERIQDESGRQVGELRIRSPKTKSWNVLLSRDHLGHWKISDWSPDSDAEVAL